MSETKKVALATTGMHCPSCALLIEMTLKKEAGVDDVKSDYVSGQTDVEYDPGKIDETAIIAKIEDLGYGATPSK